MSSVVATRAGVVDADVAGPSARFVIGLPGDPCGGILAVHSAGVDEPLQAHFSGNIDDEVEMVGGCHRVLDEQRDVVDDDRRLGVPGEVFGGAVADRRVHEGIELRRVFGIDEGRGREGRTVEASRAIEHLRAEGLCEEFEQRLTGCDDLAGDLVGIDEHGPVRDEHPRHC